MDPHVYPDPPVAPQNIANGANATAAIEQLTSSVAGNKTMFLRVAMSDPACAPLPAPTAPTLSLKADTGDFVSLVATTRPIYRTPGTDPLQYVADAKVDPDPSFNNVYRITVIFFDPAGNYAWQIRIQNNDGATRDFTWVVSGTEANTVQPWIDVVPGNLSYNVLINGSIGLSSQIRNKGTGPLTVTGVTPAPPGTLVLGALPPAVNPGRQQPLTVTFNAPATPPAPNGVITATETVNSGTGDDALATTAAGHNHQLVLTATTQALEVVLLLDDSGSMSWDPLGNNLPPGSPASRWSELVSAVNPFLNLLAFFGESRGKYGIARFPAGNPLNPATFDIVPATTIPNAAGIAAAQTAVAAITPTNGTPMGDGIDRVFAPATSYFKTDPLGINADRRWLLLMTDGAHNAGTHNPLEYILPAFGGTAAAGTSLSDKKIDLFAIGYGITGHSDVNPTLLTQLAGGSFGGGQIRRPDDAGLTAVQVASAFRDAIKSGITPASSPGDPRGLFRSGQGEARYRATLTHYDGQAAFVLHWNTPNAERLRLELLTPNCELIAPENAGQGDFKEVTFRGGDRFQMYMVGADFVRNAGDPARPRHGTWTLIITSPVMKNAAARQDFEIYEYDIIVDSDLRMDLRFDQATYFAGDPITISAQLTAEGKPITGAAVSVSTTAPVQSVNNWLAALDVPESALSKARDFLAGKDSTPLLIKTVGAGFAGLTFDARKQQTQWAMTDPSGAGVYQATIANTSTPELYTFYVTATGITEDGITFRREGKLATNVLVRPDPAFTRIDVRHLRLGAAEVRVIPRDRFGNVLLVDPNTAGGFGLVARGADLGALTSNLDGSYTRQMKFDPGASPTLSLLVGGQAVKRVTLPPVGKLRWANRVLKYRPGAEAAKGANRHTKPEAMLGNFFDKPPDTYVSLGAYGALIVMVEKLAILPAGDNDITVFIQPADDPRPYRVEVFVPLFRQQTTLPLPRFRSGWVTLGESAGETAGFSLKRARVPLAAAIRITDLSGQTRDRDLRPLDAPGVSVAAVGVVNVTDNLPWDDDAWKRFQEKPED